MTTNDETPKNELETLRDARPPSEGEQKETLHDALGSVQSMLSDLPSKISQAVSGASRRTGDPDSDGSRGPRSTGSGSTAKWRRDMDSRVEDLEGHVETIAEQIVEIAQELGGRNSKDHELTEEYRQIVLDNRGRLSLCPLCRNREQTLLAGDPAPHVFCRIPCIRDSIVARLRYPDVATAGMRQGVPTVLACRSFSADPDAGDPRQVARLWPVGAAYDALDAALEQQGEDKKTKEDRDGLLLAELWDKELNTQFPPDPSD